MGFWKCSGKWQQQGSHHVQFKPLLNFKLNLPAPISEKGQEILAISKHFARMIQGRGGGKHRFILYIRKFLNWQGYILKAFLRQVKATKNNSFCMFPRKYCKSNLHLLLNVKSCLKSLIGEGFWGYRRGQADTQLPFWHFNTRSFNTWNRLWNSREVSLRTLGSGCLKICDCSREKYRYGFLIFY